MKVCDCGGELMYTNFAPFRGWDFSQCNECNMERLAKENEDE